MIAFFDGRFARQWIKAVGGFEASFDADGLVSSLKPGGLLYDMYLGYMQDWWKHRNDENVLLLHYTDMKFDLIGTVRNLAVFSGVSLSRQEEQVILEKISFKSMSKMKDGFDIKIYGNADVEAVMCDKNECPRSKVIRKGQVGSGKDEVPEESLEKWQHIVKQDLKDPALYNWVNNGGYKRD